MYNRGDARIREYDESDEYGIPDARMDGEWFMDVVQLPHSCDAWVIGTSVQVDTLIEDLLDLQRILRKRESKLMDMRERREKEKK